MPNIMDDTHDIKPHYNVEKFETLFTKWINNDQMTALTFKYDGRAFGWRNGLG
jgi:hypothetical protein